MNTGVIASRYALALLKLTQESGRGEQVCAQVRAMLKDADAVPKQLEPDLEKFIALLVKKGRLEYLRFILSSFVKKYMDSAGIKLACLTSVIPYPGLQEKVKAILEKQTGCRIILESKVDPSIIGGFIVEVDDYFIDASVRRQLDLIRRTLVVNNNRLV